MYILLCGYPPFNGSSDEKIIEKIERGEFVFPPEEWDLVSPEAKHLIQLMLTKDPKSRPTAKEVLKHPWFRKNDQLGETSYLTNVGKRMINFRSSNHFQNAIRMYLVNFCDMKQERRQLLEAFRKIDSNGDGHLSKKELS